MPSRQERRKAERDAAKRAPAQAGAAGAGGAAAAHASANVNPVGDWKTQAADPDLLVRALGGELVKERAGEGDMEAQWSWGCRLLGELAGAAGTLSAAAGRSPQADVGFALCNARFPFAHQTATRRCGHYLTTIWFVCGCQP
jgi:hypothetical protein